MAWCVCLGKGGGGGGGVVIAFTWLRIGLQQSGMVAPLSLLISEKWMCRGSLMSSVKSTIL